MYRASIYEDTERLEKVVNANLKTKVQSFKSQRVMVQKKLKAQKIILKNLETELHLCEEDLKYLHVC